MSAQEYQRRRNSFCHFRDHNRDGRTRVELRRAQRTVAGITWGGMQPASHPAHRLHHCHGHEDHEYTSVLSAHQSWPSAPLAMAASPPPRRPSSFSFQGPSFSSPSLTQHLRLFHFFFLFSTSSKCGSTQGFNRQTCLFHQHSFFEEVSSILFFSAVPRSL